MSRVVAAEEYTPEQRRMINARLDEAGRGPFHGPFTAKETAAFLKETLKAARRAKPCEGSRKAALEGLDRRICRLGMELRNQMVQGACGVPGRRAPPAPPASESQ